MWMFVVAAYGAPAAQCPANGPDALIRIARSDLSTRVAAAACLLERHPDRALDLVEDWMQDPEAADRVAVVLDRLDTLPEDLAVAAASTGIRGPHAAVVGTAVWASTRPRVRAILAADWAEASAGGL